MRERVNLAASSYLVDAAGCCSLKEWRRLSRSLRRFSPLPSLW